MDIPIYVNVKDNSIKTVPMHVLQNTVGLKLKFIPYEIISEQRYVSHINDEEVYPPYPDEQPIQLSDYDFISITFRLPDGQMYADATEGDTYEIPPALTSVTGELSFTLEFYRLGELVMQSVQSPIIIEENEENPEPVTLDEHFPILQVLIKQVQEMKAELESNLYTKEQIDNIIQALKTNNNLV